MTGDLVSEPRTGVDHSELEGAATVPAPREPERLLERLVPPMPRGTALEPPAALRGLSLALPWLWAFLLRWSGWLGPIAVAVFGGVLRFTGLGQPNGIIFDETYYAKDAYALWHNGYESNWGDDANTKIMAGGPVPVRTDPSFIVHPPVGKWLIGAGEQLFGMHPFGWRFVMALLGTVSILMIARIGRRLFRSTLLGCVAGLLLSVDGLHFVMSRVALLDLVVMFFFLAAFGLLLLDRDRTRALIARRLEREPGGEWLFLGWRPYRLAAAASLGLMSATKWSGAPALLAFCLLSVCWDAGSRRLAGARRWWAYGIWDALFAGPVMLIVAASVYIATWTGWLLSSTAPNQGGYGRDWALHRAGLSPDHVYGIPLPQVDMTWVPNALRSLWHYHSQVWDFHTHLDTPHTYQSSSWSWLFQARPVSYFYESPKLGQNGCQVSECAREVLAIGTPLLWWTGIIALAYCLYRWALRRDWRAGAILCGLAAGYLPWFQYPHRTIFLFYAVAFVPFVVLAVTMLLGALVGPANASRERRVIGATGAGLIVLLIMWNFLYFYPLYTGQTIPMDAWRARMWFNSWI